MKIKVTLKDLTKTELLEGCLKEADRQARRASLGMNTIEWKKISECEYNVDMDYVMANRVIDWKLRETFSKQLKLIDPDCIIEKM